MQTNRIGYIYILKEPHFEARWVKMYLTDKIIDDSSKLFDIPSSRRKYDLFGTLKIDEFESAAFLVSSFKEFLYKKGIDISLSKYNTFIFNVAPYEVLEQLYNIAFVYRIKMDVTLYYEDIMTVIMFDRGIQSVLYIDDIKEDKAADEEYYDDLNYNGYDTGWTNEELQEAYDAAYEGYSRLELGLD